MESFQELSLSEPLQQAITTLGFTAPSPIQAQALPILMGEKTDFIGLAATGTGKTAAFSIPMLEKIDMSVKAVQTLILCPTRELALQVAGQIDLLGKFKGVKALPIYGGSGYGDQIYGLKAGAKVVVGTPGRVIDHLEKGTLVLDQVTTIILDEADEMISMGFKEELETVLEAAPKETTNIWLFSATMSKEVRRVADNYLKNPQQVQVNRTEMLSSNVEQIYYPSRESDKPEILVKLIEAADEFYGIIFCQTKSLVSDLTQYLMDRGYKVDCLHGDKDQNSRERTMNSFRARKVNILICTDVASRGLDVKDITHVINYSIPRELDSYVHRIGRTARSGKSGIAISLVTPANRSLIPRIEAMTKSKMKQGVIPSRRDLGAKKIAKVLEQFNSEKNYLRAMDLLGEEWGPALENMPAEEVVSRFLAIIIPDVFAPEKKGQSLGLGGSGKPKNEDERSDRRGPRREDRGPRRDDRGPRRDEQRTDSRGPRRDDRDRRGPRREERAPRRDAGPRFEEGGAVKPRRDRYAEKAPNRVATKTKNFFDEKEEKPFRNPNKKPFGERRQTT